MFDQFRIVKVKYEFYPKFNMASTNSQSADLPLFHTLEDQSGAIWTKFNTGTSTPSNYYLVGSQLPTVYSEMLQSPLLKTEKFGIKDKIVRYINQPSVLEYQSDVTTAFAAANLVATSQRSPWINISANTATNASGIPHVGLAGICEMPKGSSTESLNSVVECRVTLMMQFRTMK